MPAGVLPRAYLAEKLLVVGAAGKVSTATQQQQLFQHAFELVVALFGIAVLVTRPRIDGLASHAVVAQQGPIAGREPLRVAILVDRQGHTVRAMLGRHGAQFPQGTLQAGAKAFEALAETDRHMFPVRVGQHEVINQVRKTHTGDGHVQARQMREVRGAQLSGLVLLSEEHFPVRSPCGTPVLYPSLQRA